MLKFLLILLSLISVASFSADGLYVAPNLLYVYGNGEHESKSSMLGTGFALLGGLKVKNVGLEFGGKQMFVSNKSIGNDKYDSEIKDTVFLVGARIFLENIFSIKAGLGIHNTDMEIYKNDIRYASQEKDGTFVGAYVGMGLFHPIQKNLDFYYESTLDMVQDLDMYFLELEAGVRFYL